MINWSVVSRLCNMQTNKKLNTKRKSHRGRVKEAKSKRQSKKSRVKEAESKRQSHRD